MMPSPSSVFTAISSLEESCWMEMISGCLPKTGGRMLFSAAIEIGSGFDAAILSDNTIGRS